MLLRDETNECVCIGPEPRSDHSNVRYLSLNIYVVILRPHGCFIMISDLQVKHYRTMDDFVDRRLYRDGFKEYD